MTTKARKQDLKPDPKTDEPGLFTNSENLHLDSMKKYFPAIYDKSLFNRLNKQQLPSIQKKNSVDVTSKKQFMTHSFSDNKNSVATIVSPKMGHAAAISGRHDLISPVSGGDFAMSARTAPTNLDLGPQIKFKDFQTRNIGDLKEFKSKKLDRAKNVIANVHA